MNNNLASALMILGTLALYFAIRAAGMTLSAAAPDATANQSRGVAVTKPD